MGQHMVASDNAIHDKSRTSKRCQHLPGVHGRQRRTHAAIVIFRN
jgi:hypothetical protein